VADIAAITVRYEALKTVLDERSRRLLAAAESQAVGKGGISVVAKATGLSRPVIRQGVADLKDPNSLAAGRVRKEGGGRKRAIDKDASLKTDLQSLLESTTRGDPQAALRWTCKSVRQLTAELKRMSHEVSHQVVADLLHEMGYSLQANRKTKEGSNHPDRNAQFEHLNGKVK
jgi:transposase